MAEHPIRVGIVGANAERGWAKDAHIPALKQNPDFILEAVSARSDELAQAAAKAFGAERAFGDSLALVKDPGIDLVAVTVKVPEHHAIVMAALEAGKHVYCEWPLGRDEAESVEMQQAAAQHKGVSVIGLQGLSSPAVQEAARLVREGAIGAPKVLRVLSPTAGWGTEAPPFYSYLQDKRNGATLETIAGGHTLALVEHVVGAFTEVDARKSIFHPKVRIMGTSDFVERTCADHMIVVGSHATGCVSQVEVIGGAGETHFQFELVGEKGTIHLKGGHPGGYQVGRLELEASVPFNAEHAAYENDVSGPPANVGAAYKRIARQIRSGNGDLPDFSCAVALTRLLDTIDQAHEEGRRQIVSG